MERLVAHFTITLAEPILVEDREGAIHTFKTSCSAYEVEITWGEEDVPFRMRKLGSRWPCYGISRLIISVSHLETEPYPEDHDERVSYIEPRLEAYVKVATVVTNRLIKYFKFMLGNPLLQEITPQQLISSNPQWTDENGTPLARAIVHFQIQGPVGLSHLPGFGIKVFTPLQSGDLEEALKADSTCELYEELRADARAALVQENPRRAVLEIAISCEVVTKEFCSKKAITAGSDSVPVILNTVLKREIGTGFADSHKEHWHNIEYLFQARNKAAHGENLGYNDKYGFPQHVNYETLRNWWDSLDALIAWIRSI
jgi:hypothetical protein